MADFDHLRVWLTAGGGSFHPSVVLNAHGPFGVSVLAPKLNEDTTIVTCPLSLVITKDIASQALTTILGPDAHTRLDAWSERQLICTYLCFHHLCPEQSLHDALRHLPYVQCLPPAENLLTPLQFTPAEREVLRGTNLYGATLDRERDWRAEWTQCRSLVKSVSHASGDAFTWDMYLTASTYLSTRACPSSILSPDPSLVASPSTYPVMIPGFDLLNHKRGQPVSWIVSCPDGSTSPDSISIVTHPKPTSDADSETASPQEGLFEVFNNYGPKPNDEFILGYGFSLPENPDDTITLQIGGSGSGTSQKWVVGRRAHNVNGLWSDIKRMLFELREGEGHYFTFEADLEAAGVLSDMVQAKMDGMLTVVDVRQRDGVRPAVRVMLEHYIEGQREILKSILEFADEKRVAAIEVAREKGFDIAFEDEDLNGNPLNSDGTWDVD